MPSLSDSIDRLYTWVRSQAVLLHFTIYTRILLAIGFILPGSTKVRGVRFTIISPDTPIGSFFESFFQSGSYYGFVGLVQVLAGVLLLIPRTALLGAMLYLPVITNILAITIALEFGGTPIVVAFMLAANLYLIFWDYDRIRPIFSPDRSSPIGEVARRLEPHEKGIGKVLGLAAAATGAGILCVVGLAMSGRGLLPQAAGTFFLSSGAALAPLVAACWWEALWVRWLRPLAVSRRQMGATDST